MKKLSIEEKAKAYDEALKWMENVYPTLSHEQQMEAEVFFPMFKESEDERIRKDIITYLSTAEDKELIPYESWIAWLEKQGEQKSNPCENGELREVEQKPADKVEPKFKVGDWINGYYTNYKVLSANNEGYVVEDIDGNKINILFENEKFHHLWTIQDAKDGDVLVDDRAILLFRSLGNKNWKDVISYYVVLETNFNNWFSISDDEEYWGKVENCELKPATKEQRDILFQKMKEAGYEWDAEKKELKKIEQKPTWSEEDSPYYDDICEMLINLLHSETADVNKGAVQKDLDWLISLKPQSTWKPSDEQMEILWKYAEQNNYDGFILTSLHQQLKKLRE